MTGERGFTLVSAIFLLVVLVVLGASLMTLSSVTHTTSAQQLQAARADYAARTGIEWAVYQAAAATTCPATTLTPGGALEGFTVTVACSMTTHSLPNPDPTTVDAHPSVYQRYFVFDVAATAGTYGGPDYVQRKAQVKALGPSSTTLP